MTKSKQDTFTFGPFRLDVNDRVLLRRGKPVSLTPKAFATLLVLVQKSGRVVEKDELVRLVWPDSYVEEANIAQNIFKLRKALGKNRLGEHYIETVPRRGYRFLGLVRASKDSSAGEEVGSSCEALQKPQEGDVSSESQTIKSIAILPLNNASPDEHTEYLSDGITGSIINSLSGVPELRVMARSSVSSYKDREVDPKQVGRELNVETVLTGKILQLSDHVVIRVELVDASTGWQLWGDQYNRRPADILELQEEISREVSEQLSLKLTGKRKAGLVKAIAANQEF
ncbi:MAG TPA: winged helix-turn-helix domain-containing protein [Pyrinomonadaceae bacterium]|nr:winged helix-turn-helix domain-containing protein [Pyrinomonadaceae bacterium]